MDALITDLQLVSVQLLPIVGLVVLIFLCLLLKKAILLVEHVTKTVDQLEPTMKLVDQSLEKVQAPLDTTVKYSKSLDNMHDKMSSAMSKASKAVSQNLESLKKRPSKRRTTVMTDKNESYDDSFENIEKTVEDLKKKLQRLETEQEESSFPDVPKGKSLVDEVVDSTKELKEDASDKVEELGEKLKTNESLQKTLSYVKEHARQSQEVLEETVKKVQDSSQWKEFSEKFEDGKQQFEEKVLPKIQETWQDAYGKVKDIVESEEVQSKVDEAKKLGKSLWKALQDKWKEKK